MRLRNAKERASAGRGFGPPALWAADTMKREILYTFLLLFLPLTAAQAQLVFDPARHDFGTVREIDGKVSHTFTGVNRGDRPVVLLDVVTSCGCTVPAFSKKPVLPGDSTRITVTYDPENRPGGFIKELSVYSSERQKVATLTIEGTVTPRAKRVDELYPVDAGGGVRLSTTLASFSYLPVGRETHAAVEVINTARTPVRLELRPSERSGCLRVTAPQELAPGERATIDLAYLVPADAPRYGTLSDVLEVVTEGRRRSTQILVHAIAVDDPAPLRGQPSPTALLSTNILKFGTLIYGSDSVTQTFRLTNTGKAELIVRAVECKGAVRCSLRGGERIAAGKALPVVVTVAPGEADYGPLLDRISIITNDPAHPMRQLRVTAIIEAD